MEKLQAALEKAREKRVSAGVQPGDPARRTRSGADAATAAWNQIPRLEFEQRRLVKKRLVALRGGGEATPYDVLRTKVLQMMNANKWKRLLITSPAPGSGKTTTSANLAISLARQIDLRIVLMDLDMRRPALAKLIGYRHDSGADAVLSGEAKFGEQARRMGENLAVSMNYASTKDPSDLFLRSQTSDIIDQIEAEYRPDLMLFDMPPMLVNDDTSAFCGNVDCALIIAEAGVSTIAQVDTCEKELADQTNILGVVLNKCRFQSDGYGYYYYNYGY